MPQSMLNQFLRVCASGRQPNVLFRLHNGRHKKEVRVLGNARRRIVEGGGKEIGIFLGPVAKSHHFPRCVVAILTICKVDNLPHNRNDIDDLIFSFVLFASNSGGCIAIKLS